MTGSYNRLGMPEVIPARDHVVICGQVVQRPASISPSQWLQFWEEIKLNLNG